MKTKAKLFYTKKLLAIATGMAVAFSANAKSVEEVVKEALETNPEIAAAVYDINANMASKDAAFAGYLPTISLTADAGKEWNEDELTPRESTDRWQAAIQLRQALWRGGYITSDNDRATAELEAAIFSAHAKAEDLSLRVIEAYLNVVKSKELVHLAQSNLDMHNKTREKVEMRHGEGVGDRADVIQINGRISRALANLNNARNELQDARSEYVALVGTLPVVTIRPQPNGESMPMSAEEAQKIALDHNPQFMQALKEVEVAEYNYGIRKAGHHPTVDLVLEHGVKQDVAGIPGRHTDSKAVVEFKWDLYAGGRNSATAKSAAYRVNQAKMDANTTRRDILQRIDLIWSSYMRSRQNIDLLRDYVVYAKQSEALYADQYFVDRRSLLDLLDSANELFEARKSYLDAEFRLINDEYRMMESLGVLTESLGIDVGSSIEQEVTRNEEK